jgi:cation-transporting ATPase E
MRSGAPVTRNVADVVLVNDSFAALPAAFQEGQRILNGMETVIRLILARTGYVALIILGVSLLGEPFPVTPKHNGAVALLTVGIPTVALAAWARPGTPPRRLVTSAGHFVVPAALTIAGVGITVYAFFRQATGDTEMARSAVAVVSILCGLTLIPFARPPSDAWAGGSPATGDRRPLLFALLMLAVFILSMIPRSLRDYSGMRSLSWSGYVMLALVTLGWAVALRSIWRLRLEDYLDEPLQWLRRRLGR